MRISESRLRSFIRSVIKESRSGFDDFMTNVSTVKSHMGHDDYDDIYMKWDNVENSLRDDEYYMIDELRMDSEDLHPDDDYRYSFEDRANNWLFKVFLKNLVEKVRFHCNSPLRRSRHDSPFHDALRLIKDQGSNCISLEHNEQNRPVIKLSESCPLSNEEKIRIESEIEKRAYDYYKSPKSERRSFGKFAQSIYSMIVSAYSR